MNEEKYTNEIIVDDKKVKYYISEKNNYICKIVSWHSKYGNLRFSSKAENGIDGIKNKASAMIKIMKKDIEKFGHLNIEFKTQTDMRITVSKISYFPNKCWFFRYFKYKTIKGFIIRVFGYDIRVFGYDINVREHNSVNKFAEKIKQTQKELI